MIVLRVLWSEGVRVAKRPDGSLGLIPSELVTPDILQLAKDAKPEIAAAMAALPSGGSCPICGSSTGHADLDQLHCVDCALIGLERVCAELDISPKAQNGVAA